MFVTIAPRFYWICKKESCHIRNIHQCVILDPIISNFLKKWLPFYLLPIYRSPNGIREQHWLILPIRNTPFSQENLNRFWTKILKCIWLLFPSSKHPLQTEALFKISVLMANMLVMQLPISFKFNFVGLFNAATFIFWTSRKFLACNIRIGAHKYTTALKGRANGNT